MFLRKIWQLGCTGSSFLGDYEIGAEQSHMSIKENELQCVYAETQFYGKFSFRINI